MVCFHDKKLIIECSAVLLILGLVVPTILVLWPNGNDDDLPHAVPAPFDVLVSSSVHPAAYPGGLLIATLELIGVTYIDYSTFPTIDEATALCVAQDFASTIDYIEGLELDLSADFFSRGTPVWVVNGPLKGGNLCIWINALTGAVILFSVRVSSSSTTPSPLGDYFADPGNLTSLEIEEAAFEFLMSHGYTLPTRVRYAGLSYSPGSHSVGFVNGIYRLLFAGVTYDDVELGRNRVVLELEASTGAVLEFYYDWIDFPDIHGSGVVSSAEASNIAVQFVVDWRTTTPGVDSTRLVLEQVVYDDDDLTRTLSHILLWTVELYGTEIDMVWVNAITGEIAGYILREVYGIPPSHQR